MDTSVLVFLWGPPVPWCPHGLPCPLGFPKQPVQVGWRRAASGRDAAAAVPILIFLPLTPRLAITQAAPLGATLGTDGSSLLPVSLSLQAAARWQLPGGAPRCPAASRPKAGQVPAAAKTPVGTRTATTTPPRAGSAGALVRPALLHACPRL